MLPPVQMLWYGKPLSSLERLSIVSFLHHGHDVHLYVYGTVENVPTGVTMCDASEIIPEREMHALRDRGVPPGVFSDYWRYALLNQRGGWWVDADVVCVRPFEFGSDIVFAYQDEQTINGAVLRLPAGHFVLDGLLDTCVRPNRWREGDTWRGRTRKVVNRLRGRGLEAAYWGSTGPNALTAAAHKHDLLMHALPPAAFYPVPWTDWRVLCDPGDLELGPDSYAIHTWNEMWRRSGVDAPEPGSPLARLMSRYLEP